MPPKITAITLIGHQIHGLLVNYKFDPSNAGPVQIPPFGLQATIPRVAHVSLEIDYSDGTKSILESGPSGGLLVPTQYNDTSKPLFTVPISVPGQSLDQTADTISSGYFMASTWATPYDRNSIHYLFDNVDANSNSILSGSLQNAGVDLTSVDAAITSQGEDLRFVGGFDKPYNPGGDEHIYNEVKNVDDPSDVDPSDVDPEVVAYDPALSQTDVGIGPASAEDAVAAAAARNAPAAQLGSDIVTANNFVNDATGIARGGLGAVSGVANIGATLLGSRSAVGSDLVSANTAVGDATGLYGIAGDIEHPTVAAAVVDSTRVASMIAGSGTTLGTQLAGAATGFGAAYGVVAGFEQGGALGGLESAASLETLAPLVGLTGGVALPIAIGVGLVSAIFGGNHDVPANMPDKYDTQRFGQELADLGGTSGANGQSFVEDPKLKAALGGATGIAAVEETLAQYGTPQSAPSWLASMFGKLKAMFGESATGSGQLNFEHAIGNEWVTGAAGTDGRHYKYSDLASALYDFVNAKVANAPATGVASVDAAAGTPTSISSGLSQAPPDTGRDTIEIVARRPIETPAPGGSANLGLLAATYGAHERYFNDQRSSRVLAM